jgi:hypothetical protein
MALPIPIMGVEAAAAAEAASGGGGGGGSDMRIASGRNAMPKMASAGQGSMSTLQGTLGVGRDQSGAASTLSIVSPSLMSALSPMYGAGRPRGYVPGSVVEDTEPMSVL